MYTLKELAKIARAHGFKTSLHSVAVMVWDQDGSEAVTTLQQLKKFMGY